MSVCNVAFLVIRGGYKIIFIQKIILKLLCMGEKGGVYHVIHIMTEETVCTFVI